MIQKAPHRIVHIGSARYPIANRSHHTYSIWKNLSAGFHEYHVFARSTGPAGSISEDSLKVHLIGSLINREIEFFFTQFLFVFLALRLKPNAVVSQNPVVGGLAGLMISFLLKIPHLVEIHNVAFVREGDGGLKLRFLRFLAGFVYKRADCIRVLTPRMRDDMLSLYRNIAPSRVIVLPPRANLSIFTGNSTGRSDDRLHVIMVGAVVEGKGQLRAIRALSNSSVKLKILVVGDGPQLEECKRTAASLSSDRLEVEFAGLVPPETVAMLLLSSDVFLMNSLSEGLPRAILEAMALGLPIITTDAGYCSDIVTDGLDGFVIPIANNDQILIDCIEFLSRDPVRRRQMGGAAKAKISGEFASDLNFARYRFIISTMIDDFGTGVSRAHTR